MSKSKSFRGQRKKKLLCNCYRCTGTTKEKLIKAKSMEKTSKELLDSIKEPFKVTLEDKVWFETDFFLGKVIDKIHSHMESNNITNSQLLKFGLPIDNLEDVDEICLDIDALTIEDALAILTLLGLRIENFTLGYARP